jgi:hypothetical protein
MRSDFELLPTSWLAAAGWLSAEAILLHELERQRTGPTLGRLARENRICLHHAHNRQDRH